MPGTVTVEAAWRPRLLASPLGPAPDLPLGFALFRLVFGFLPPWASPSRPWWLLFETSIVGMRLGLPVSLVWGEVLVAARRALCG